MKEQINTLLKSIGLKAEEIKLMEAKLADGQTMIEAEPDFEAGAAVMVVTVRLTSLRTVERSQ